MKKPIYYLSWFILLSLMGFYLRYFYLAYVPVKTITIQNPMKVITPRVKAGDDLIYQATYCRYFSGSGKVTRTITGPDIVPSPAVNTVTKLGCDTAKIHLNIPGSITPGVYHLEISAEFQVTPYQLVTKNYQTENFEVYK